MKRGGESKAKWEYFIHTYISGTHFPMNGELPF